jgi:hypothetical protein
MRLNASLRTVSVTKCVRRITQPSIYPLRRKMMQGWADFVDGLRTGAKVVNLHAVGK